MSEKEAVMERKLIDQLTKGVSQWTYRPDIRTEEDLWANFRDKLNQNNKAVLNGQDITDSEFRQIREFIDKVSRTPFKAGCWLAGENGVAQIALVRDEAAQGKIMLKVVNNREIAGGNSSYEVINQYTSTHVNDLDEDRRFDVTLLINGMPMIQIELKNRDHPFMDGFRQIQKYSEQGHYQGLFGLLQMFVVTNGTDTRYIAAAPAGELNARFLTSWLDEKNELVTDYLDFAKAVLSIPAAHKMVGKYSVMDKTRECVILLRPYQIHAIEAIRLASYQGQSGFIWHTTGSGKTLTSYNVTKNLLDIPSIDKTLFLIDRKDLDTQTTDEFQAYAETDSLDVDETDNTRDLEKKLLAKGSQAIVTTIQKLQTLLRRYSGKAIEEDPKKRGKYKKLKALHLAFIVDECHRTVSPRTKRILEQYFRDALWYGFTGTPLFGENKKKVEGNLPDTTEKLYGPCLHNYTIKEAIRNGAVLGFNVEMHDNLTDEELLELAAKLKLSSPQELRYLERWKLEEKVLDGYRNIFHEDFYDNDDHKKEVIRYILDKCEGKFGMNKGEGHTYDAILTVGSIEEAQTYYNMFKELVAEGAVSERVQKKLPDFPKIAITYTVGENQDGARANQALMKASLADYNGLFHTHFTLEDNLRGYNEDLQKRLARKEEKYRDRSEQLDLVIVVNRLLTGFDAPCLSTLFVDRYPMPPQNIIQAFSRTNRIFDATKIYGQIVIFRTPGTYKKDIDDAIYLYSNGGSPSDVMAPTYEEMEKRLRKAITGMEKAAQGIEGQDLKALETDELTHYAKAYQELDHTLASIFVYTEWEDEFLSKRYGLSEKKLEDYKGRYQNIIAELRERKDHTGGDVDPDIPDIDIEYELEATSSAVINYKYIVALIQKYIPKASALLAPDATKNEVLIQKSLEKLAKSNPKLTEIIERVWEKIKAHPVDFTGQSAMDLIQAEIHQTVEGKVRDLADTWCANVEDIKFHAYHYKETDDLMDLKLNYQAYKEKGGTLFKLLYLSTAREEIKKAIQDSIRPLLEF